MTVAPRTRRPLHFRPATDPARRSFDAALRRLLRQAGLGLSGGCRGERRGAGVRLGREGNVSGRMRRVQDYVAANVGEVRTLDDLAGVAGLSRFHFARRFRDEVGEPPWAFVRRVRAEEARRLLREGRSPAEAAHEAGFADQAHLTRALRTRYGRTPGQLRRAARDEAASRTAPGERGADRKDVQDRPPR